MADMDWGALIQAVGPVIGGIAANQAGAPDREQQRRILEMMLKKYGAIQTPGLEEAGAEQLGDTALGGVSTDPRLQDAEYGSLDALKKIQDMGGLTLEDQSALNKVQNRTARHESAGRASIANDFASRGQLGSANQLAMSMQNQQDSANRSAEAGMDTAASAQKRYFDSILQRGRLGGEMDDRQYRQKAEAARARDSIAQHNAAARTDAARYRNDVRNQGFSNKMALAGAQSGAGYKQANYLGNESSRKAEQTGRAWDAGLKGASTLTESGGKRDASGNAYDSEPNEWENPWR